MPHSPSSHTVEFLPLYPPTPQPHSKATRPLLNPYNGEILTQVQLTPLQGRASLSSKEPPPAQPLKNARLLYALSQSLKKEIVHLATLQSLTCGVPITQSLDHIKLLAKETAYWAGWTDKLTYLFFGRKVLPQGTIILTTNTLQPFSEILEKLAMVLATNNSCFCVFPLYLSPFAHWLECFFSRYQASHSFDYILTENPKEVHATLLAQGYTFSPALAHEGRGLHIVCHPISPSQIAHTLINQSLLTHAYKPGNTHLLIEEKVYEPLIQALQKRFSKLTINQPLHPTTHLGPLPTQSAQQSQLDYKQLALREGALEKKHVPHFPQKGNFAPPLFIPDLSPTSRLNHPDASGYILTASSFRTPEEALALSKLYAPFGKAHLWGGHSATLLFLSQGLRYPSPTSPSLATRLAPLLSFS